MSLGKMSQTMEAWVRQGVFSGLENTQIVFDRAISPALTQPMSTLTNTITFTATGPEGTRQFTLTVTLAEASTVVPANTTAGHAH